MDQDKPTHTVIKTSAPTKIIISGEHSVVSGHLALAIPIDFRVNVALHQSHTNKHSCILQIHTKIYKPLELKWNIRELPQPPNNPSNKFVFDKTLLQTLKSIKHEGPDRIHILADKARLIFLGLLYAFGCQRRPMVCRITSNIPVFGGLGSSASFTAALASAFYCFIKKLKNSDRMGFNAEDMDVVNKYTLACEKMSHGTPSGIDNTAVVYGGFVVFKDKERQPKSLEDSAVQDYFKANWRILVVDSGVVRDTKKYVKKVTAIKTRFAMAVERIFEAIDAIGGKIYETMEAFIARKDGYPLKHHQDDIRYLLAMNHSLLKALGVSTRELDRICEICERSGVGAKLTGAGGGGSVFCLVPKEFPEKAVESLTRSLQREGFASVFGEIAMRGILVKMEVAKRDFE